MWVELEENSQIYRKEGTWRGICPRRKGRKKRGCVVLASRCWVNAIRYCKQILEELLMCASPQTYRDYLSPAPPFMIPSHTHTHTQLAYIFIDRAHQQLAQREHLMWRGPRIDMWTACYKSTSLKLNCAKSIAVQIPHWLPLILIINLLSHSHKRAHIPTATGLKLWESTARRMIP